MTEATAKPLGKITALLADLGLEVTYAYDDLVFVQHSAFLLQFTEQPRTMELFTNSECHPGEANLMIYKIIDSFKRDGFTVVPGGHFTLTQGEEQTLEIEFV